jgi:hypothetical protein
VPSGCFILNIAIIFAKIQKNECKTKEINIFLEKNVAGQQISTDSAAEHRQVVKRSNARPQSFYLLGRIRHHYIKKTTSPVEVKLFFLNYPSS